MEGRGRHEEGWMRGWRGGGMEGRGRHEEGWGEDGEEGEA